MKKSVVASVLLGAGLFVVASLAAIGEPSALAASTSAPSASSSPTSTPTATPSPTPPAPLRVVSVSPRRNARQVSPAAAITVRFSAALAAGSNVPRLSPKIPGKWRIVDSSTLVFRPTGHLPVFTTVGLSIPPGSAGAHGSDGGRLATKFTVSFAVKGPSSLARLQQLLAEVGYLPLRFRLTTGQKGSALSNEPRTTDLISLQPLTGLFSWRYSHVPSSLAALWKRGQNSALVKGAVMAFESGHGLPADGVAGRGLWTALLKMAAAHSQHSAAYDYIEVSTSLPERLRVWRSGRVIFTSRANTGIASRPTAKGTFPVYARYLSTTMSGTNPDGTHYSDPGVPHVAYFNGGDAVHGFPRPGYGYPQSLGCVELPYAAAAVVFKYDPIGTLVTVS